MSPESGPLRVTRSVAIPMSEIELRHSTSGRPGGQHANKASTRIDLSWNVDRSAALGPRQRERIRDRLRNRIDTSGNLQLSSAAHRSQLRNREEVLERLARLLEDALHVEKKRRPTKPSRRATDERIQQKKRRGAIKRSRRGVNEDS
ncbi:MAG TPA: alternative ribosome rescue aminoacyl-tRNA hydrolase ArfB [Actinomycetota bacterium]|nr:alternative ribosome rescue aminoacyl-tRNA hydrolase ArfB [Actinomycetota bacterium]